MGFAADISENPAGRTAERATLRLAGGIRRRGEHRARAEILDLSTHGFRIEASIAMARDMQVWLTIPGFEPKAARVVWVEGSFAGCEFETPFHPSVLERIVALNR